MLSNQETLNLLRKLGYRYLVVETNQMIAYATREPIPKESLDLIGLKEFEIEKMSATQIAALEMYNVEVTVKH
jgi:hypothetical protein